MPGHDLQPPAASVITEDVARALAEDLGSGDVTASLLADGPEQGYVVAKEAAVIAGRPTNDACYKALDPEYPVLPALRDYANLRSRSPQPCGVGVRKSAETRKENHP